MNNIIVGLLFFVILCSCNNSSKYILTKNKLINVTSFGAIGDGVFDNTKAIQEAINFASNLKTGVYFPKGTYIISRTTIVANKKYGLVIPSNVVLKGEDWRNTIIKLGPDHKGFARMVNLIDVENISLFNLSFDGNLSAQQYQEEHQGGVWLHNADNIIIRNCHFYNTGGDGIGVRGPKNPSENVLVKACSFRDNGRNGITLGSGFKGVVIDSCYFDATNIHASPIDSEPESGLCSNVIISNINVVNKSNQSTIITFGGHVPVSGYNMFNSNLENCGIHMVRAYDVKLSNNVIKVYDERPAINLIYESKNVSIDKNNIEANKDAIALIATKTSAPSNITIIGNTIKTSSSISRGIRIQGAKKIEIKENTIKSLNQDSKAGAIFIRSTRDVDQVSIRGNSIIDYENAFSLNAYSNFSISNLDIDDNEIILKKYGKELDCLQCENMKKSGQIEFQIGRNIIKNQ